MKSKIFRYTATICLLALFVQGCVCTGMAADVQSGDPLLVVSSGCNRVYAGGTYAAIDELDDTVRCYVSSGDTYVPLEFAVEATGGSVEKDGGTLKLTNNLGKVYYVTTDRKTVYQKKSVIQNAEIETSKGTVFMLAEQLAEILNTKVYYNESVAYFMQGSLAPTEETMERIEASLFFVRPTAEQVIADLKAANPDNDHPRLLARKEDFDRIRTTVQNDELVAGWYASIKKTAESSINQPPYRWELRDGLRLLYVSQDVTSRVRALALAWQIDRDPRYAERAYLELKAVCDYPNWVLTHWLDIGQMCQGVAIGYDWIHDWMNDEQRETIKNGIVRLGLKPFEERYNEFLRGEASETGWLNVSTNWNPWCNSGSIMAALAVGVEAPEIAGFTIETALKSFEKSLDEYGPDGGGTEGLSYGNNTLSNVTYIIGCLDSSIGKDYGYFNKPGYPAFAYYLSYMNGPNTAFGYGENGGTSKVYLSSSFFVANKIGDYAIANMRLDDIAQKRTTSNFLDILYYRPELYGSESSELSLDRYFRKVETGTMRSSWDDPEAIWFGFHGGDSSVGHSQLDSGTFVLDAMGLNWALDLGTEQLTYTGTSEQMGGDPYLLYRMSAQGHNCLQINLNKERGQVLESVSEVTEFVSKPAGAYAIMDLTEAYSHVAANAKRGFALFEDRSVAVVQDEIELKEKSDVWWLMHTPALIEVSEDGKTAILTQKGKRLRASIIEPADGTFYAMKAEALPGTPSTPYETVNTGVQKLAMNVPETVKTNIMIQFDTIYVDSDLEKPLLDYVPLDEWAVADHEIIRPEIDNIYINGTPLADFESSLTRYKVSSFSAADEAPVVTADSKYNVDIVQPKNPTNSVAQITVTDDNGNKNVYTITFNIEPFAGLPATGKAVTAVSAVASYEQVDSTNKNYAKNAIDGDLSTRWSADGRQWLLVELAELKKLTHISLAFYQGHTRQNYFNIEVSADGENWTTVFDGESTGTTSDYESYPITPTEAKYIRLNCRGHSQSTAGWNSLSEIVATAE